MNGRVYDPTLGRFLSADPHIQSPYSSQSYNRYSYVSNNPLKYTDPSGYFLGSIFKAIGNVISGIAGAIKSAFQNPLIRAVVSVYGAYLIGTAVTNSIFISSAKAIAAGAGNMATVAVSTAMSAAYTSAAVIGGAVGGALDASWQVAVI
jgi:hypothetical protein